MVTPDLKLGDAGVLIHVDLAAGARRLGGSALAQAYNQLGHECPDVSAQQLAPMWEVTQSLLAAGHLSAGHDISDGGIATALLEMAFAGNCGIQVDLPLPAGGAMAALYAEELGLVLEVEAGKAATVLEAYKKAGVSAAKIGSVRHSTACAAHWPMHACTHSLRAIRYASSHACSLKVEPVVLW